MFSRVFRMCSACVPQFMYNDYKIALRYYPFIILSVYSFYLFPLRENLSFLDNYIVFLIFLNIDFFWYVDVDNV